MKYRLHVIWTITILVLTITAFNQSELVIGVVKIVMSVVCLYTFYNLIATIRRKRK